MQPFSLYEDRGSHGPALAELLLVGKKLRDLFIMFIYVRILHVIVSASRHKLSDKMIAIK